MKLRASEYLLLSSGLLILASVAAIFLFQSFLLFVSAKVLYAIGALLYLFDKKPT